MKLCTYLHFDGRTREAFAFYAKVFGGKINSMMTYGETPVAEHVPPSAHQAIMHASLDIGDQVLMGSDGTPDHPYQGIRGVHVVIALSDVSEAERIFAALSDGGEVAMPLTETFWAARYGMMTDRFGVPWMVNCAFPASDGGCST
jgi:PhnB protein